MKKLVLIVCFISMKAFAAEHDAAQETTDIASALLSSRNAKQLAEFSNYADTVTSVKVNEMNGVTEYTVSGIKLNGKDTPCGSGILVIQKSVSTPAFGFSSSGVPFYSAKVSGQTNCQ